MATSSTERVISQIGDSTDGEDFELDDSDKNDFVETKLNKECSGNIYTGDIYWGPRCYGIRTFNYSTTCKLKVIGHYLLQSPKIRAEYKKIKSQFIPQEVKQECLKLDEIIGRGWSIIVKHFDGSGKDNELCFRRFYEINKKIIDEFLLSKENEDFNNMTDAKKAEYYLKEKASTAEIDINKPDWVQTFFKKIHDLQHSINFGQEFHRDLTEYLQFIDGPEELPEASKFLARIKADFKLDKDLAKFYLYENKQGFSIIKSKMIKSTKYLEMMDIYPDGKFMLWKMDTGKYTVLEGKLLDLVSENAIDLTKIKRFIKSALRGKLDESIVVNQDLKENALKVLKSAIELIFGLEAKRNPSALITGAMFFDLINVGKYKIADISKKLPMATNGVTKATAIIDEIMGRPSRYDFFGPYKNLPNQDVLKLRKSENELVQDWIKFKLNKPKSSADVEEVAANLINELIMDWYGIDMPQLRKGTIELEPGTGSRKIRTTKVCEATASSAGSVKVSDNLSSDLPSPAKRLDTGTTHNQEKNIY